MITMDMLDIHVIDLKKVSTVEWTGNPIEYDQRLSQLGKRHNKFLVVNPVMADYSELIEKSIDSDQCVVWKIQGDWIAKQFNKSWTPEKGYKEIELKQPNLTWRKNPDLDRTMTFEDDPFEEFTPEPWDWHYELVWYIDPRFNPLEDKVWALSCKPLGGKIKGVKDMGYVVPKVNVDINSDLKDISIDIDILCPAFWDLAYECAYQLDPKHTPDQEMWVVKFSPAYRKPKDWKWYGVIEPEFEVEYNPDLPDLDYELDYVIPWHDIGYDHVWMLNRCHLQNNEEDIWAFKIITSKESKGTKVIGEISPEVTFYTNANLPEFNYDIEYITPWHDFQYEHVWMLDQSHQTETVDPIWAVKATYTKKPEGSKIIGETSPHIEKIVNPELSELDFSIEYSIPYYDLEYEHLWILDQCHTKDLEYEVWAVKWSAVTNPKGTKKIGYVSPDAIIEKNKDIDDYDFPRDLYKHIQYYDFRYTNVFKLDKDFSAGHDIWATQIKFVKNPQGYKEHGVITPGSLVEYNPDLSHIDFKIDYKIPYHDRHYLHLWHLDPAFCNEELIWYAKAKAIVDTQGQKVMGFITPDMPKYLDVIFISYNESNADANFDRLKAIAPWAKRVHGVKGIFKAHLAAARLATTDMFYVVDGDAELLDNWKFNFQPNIFDRDCAYVWSSRNPINDLTYGYGGIKLFNKSILMSKKSWSTLDMFTGIMPKLKVQTRVSNISAFNTDPFSTWRSSFRECVKLKYNLITNPEDKESKFRLETWLTVGADRPFGQYAIDAAHAAVKFTELNHNNTKELLKINDFSWLKKEFNNTYE